MAFPPSGDRLSEIFSGDVDGAAFVGQEIGFRREVRGYGILATFGRLNRFWCSVKLRCCTVSRIEVGYMAGYVQVEATGDQLLFVHRLCM